MKAQSNALIMAQAASHLVEAYKALIQEYQSVTPLDLRIMADAPETFEGLVANAKAGFLAVTQAYSETSIYGIAGNVTFRVFHDYGHIIYGRKFNTLDEIALARTQWLDIEPSIPHEWRAICKCLYERDTVGQSLYEHRTGAFPADQKAFAMERLNQFLNGWGHNANFA